MGIWGSAVADNWYGGSFVSGYRSSCTNIYMGQANPNMQYPFTYGKTIAGYGDGWFQQNGRYGCLHGATTGLGLNQDMLDSYNTGVYCSGDLQFLIR